MNPCVALEMESCVDMSHILPFWDHDIKDDVMSDLSHPFIYF